MFLAYYIGKIFDFLAENFRRAAKFLSVKSAVQNNPPSDKKSSLPPAHWLEITQHIPPEQWIDFSGEAARDSMPVLTEANSVIQESTVFTEKNRAVKESTGKVRNQASASSRHTNVETPSEGIIHPRKKKTKPGLLSFKVLDKKPPDKTAEPLHFSKKSAQKSSAPSEESFAPAKRRFRIMPSSPILGKKRKTVVSSAPPIKNSVEKPSEQNQPIAIFYREKTADFYREKPVERNSETVSPKTKNKNERQNKIGDDSDSEKRFSFETHCRNESDRSETAGTSFNYSKPNHPNHFTFASVTKTEARAPQIFQAREKSAKTAPEDVKTSYKRKMKNEGENRVFAEPPWAELPDEFLPGEFDGIETKRFEAEHLLYLEREQQGS